MRTVIISIIGCAFLVLPGAASAHSATVTCGDTGIVFSYHNDFPVTEPVTEVVNGVSKTVTVTAHTASTDTIPAPSDHVTAYATWDGGGSVPPTNLVCPYTPPGLDLCQNTEVVKTVYTPGPETIKYIPYEVDKYVTKIKTVVKHKIRIRWKVVYRFIHVKPPHPVKPRGGGVAG